MAVSIMSTPIICTPVILSPRISHAQITATGNSTVMSIELRGAPIFGIPAANKAVGIAVPTTASRRIHKANSPQRYSPAAILGAFMAKIVIDEPNMIAMLFASQRTQRPH